MNLGSYCLWSVIRDLWSVIWRFSITREELELTDIRDFTTLLHVILRQEPFEWVEPSNRYGNYKMVPRLSLSWLIFLSSITLSSVRVGYWKEHLTCLFSWFGKTKFLYPWSVILHFFRSWTVPEIPPSCMTFSKGSGITTLGIQVSSALHGIRDQAVLDNYI